MTESQTDKAYKLGLLAEYDENCQVDEMRRQVSNKPSWGHLPYQDLHTKLDILEKNFLSKPNKKNQSANNTYSEAYELLEHKIRKSENIPQNIKMKMECFMSNYIHSYQSKIEKGVKIEKLRKEIDETLRENKEIENQIEEEEIAIHKLKYENINKEKMSNKINDKVKLIFS